MTNVTIPPRSICTTCNRDLEISLFTIHPRYSRGYTPQCTACMADTKRKYRERLEKRDNIPIADEKQCTVCGFIKHSSAFRQSRLVKSGLKSACRGCENGLRRRPGRTRKPGRPATQRVLQRKYGLTLDDIAQMTEHQQGRCAICGETGHKLNVDHCHRTGAVRGLLCKRCNFGLGLFKDSTGSLQSAIQYLVKSKTADQSETS